jgi:hypothetical protein
MWRRAVAFKVLRRRRVDHWHSDYQHLYTGSCRSSSIVVLTRDPTMPKDLLNEIGVQFLFAVVTALFPFPLLPLPFKLDIDPVPRIQIRMDRLLD